MYAGKHGRHDFVRISGQKSGPGLLRTEEWFARLLLLFSYKVGNNDRPDMAFVRWLEPVAAPNHAKNLRLQPLKYNSKRVLGFRHHVPSTDIVPLLSIRGPCLLQPDPFKTNDIYYFNQWVGNVHSA